MDQISMKTPNPKCHLYWCLMEFIDMRYSQSCCYFRPLLWTVLSLYGTFSYIKSTKVYVQSSELDSPNPSLASECAPPASPQNRGEGGTLTSGWGGHTHQRVRGAHSPAGEGLGESQFRRLEKKLSTLPTLCLTWGRGRGEGDRRPQTDKHLPPSTFTSHF